MSATNLDLPVLISADQIRRREFVTTRRGYDPDQVRAYLEQLADQVELMRVLMREAQQEAEAAARTSARPHEDPYEKLAQRVSGVIREADKAAETIRGEAATEADRLTREARVDADRIRGDAQAKAAEARSLADDAMRKAREQADRTIAGLSTRRDALVDQLTSMQERLIGVARDLESAMDVQVTLPALATIEDLFDDSTGHERGGEPTARSKGAPVQATAPGEVADAVPETGEAEPPLLIGEPARPAHDHMPEDQEPLMDPSYEDLWEGTDAMRFDLPDIPALDLDWEEREDEA